MNHYLAIYFAIVQTVFHLLFVFENSIPAIYEKEQSALGGALGYSCIMCFLICYFEFNLAI